MRQRLLCVLVTGLAAAALFWSGIETAGAAGGGQAPASDERMALRPPSHNVPTAASEQAGAPEGGDLIVVVEDPPFPDGAIGYIIFADCPEQDRVANDVQFADATPIVQVEIFFDDSNFSTDPNNPGSDFTLFIWNDDGTGNAPTSPPLTSHIFTTGPLQPNDGTLSFHLEPTAIGGDDSINTATFNFNSEFFVFQPNTKYWIGMCGDAPADARIGIAESNNPASDLMPAQQSFQGAAWASVDVGPDPAVPVDTGFRLSAFAPTGGTTVLSLSGSTMGAGCPGHAGQCCIKITPTTAPITSCMGGACANDPIFGSGCNFEAALPANVSADLAAAALKAQFDAAAGCNHSIMTVQAVGPRLIVTTTAGTKPKICASINGAAVGLVGGTGDCTVTGCGISMQVGPTTTLPEVALGFDRFTTVLGECSLPGNDPNGSWINLSLMGDLFAQPGLPAAGNVSTRVRLNGVARNFATDDSDTLIRRTDKILFGLCSGDFSRPGATPKVYSPDGVVDQSDLDAMGAAAGANVCFGQAENQGTHLFPDADCEFFDYNGDDMVNAADRAVLQCLIASGNSPECCPNNTDTPQRASSRIPTELSRLHLRGCDYLPVTRTGIGCPENWVVDVYPSPIAPQIGANDIGPCATGDTQGANGNDVIANAQNLGLLSEGAPQRVGGRIGNTTTCDSAPNWPGDMDGDMYRFSVAFRTTVNIDVDALDTAPQCAGVSPAASTSLWLYDARGIRLANSDSAGASDPAVSRELKPGVYFVLVASAGQTSEPSPKGRPGNPNCSIGSSPEVDGGATPPTGFYDLKLAAVPGSNIVVRQSDANCGTYQSRTLVQPLVTYQKVCDPQHAVLVDTGGTNVNAFALAGSGVWARSVAPGSNYEPGDPNFIPGVDCAGASMPVQLTEANGAGFAQHVRATTRRVCETVFDTCAYSQAPDPDLTVPAINALHTSAANFPVADNFTLTSAATIKSVTFWVTPSGTVTADHTFEVEIRDNNAGAPVACALGIPGTVVASGVTGDPFITPTTIADVDQVTLNLGAPFNALANTRYWLVLRLDTVHSPSGENVQFVTSLQGDGKFMHDVVSAAGQPGDPATDCIADDGNGWDCAVSADMAATECNEANPDGDQRDGNLAFCVGTDVASGFTKELPADVACGTWRSSTGRIIWTQPFVLRGDGTIGFFSDFMAPATGNQAADSFTAYEAGQITDIHWRGAYTSNSPVFAADAFRIEFWSDGQNVPSTLLDTLSLTNAQIVRTPGMVSGDPGRQIYNYSHVLAAPRPVAANETLWVSIINTVVGQSYRWTFATAAGGNSDGHAALKATDGAWETLPGAGDPATDFSFDITVAGTTKIVTGDSVACAVGENSRLGYRFDPQLCHINGLQSKAPVGTPNESTGNRWRNVSAPWKYFEEVNGGGAGQGQLATLLGQLTHPQAVSAEEISCLTANTGGSTIASVFGGLAAYDTDPAVNGIGVGGALHRLCNGALVADIDPTEALDERLNVKGVMWTNGTTTFVVGTGDVPPPPPMIVHQTGQAGQTQPCSGYIDPRRESTTGPGNLNAGMISTNIRFNQPVSRCDNGMSLEGALTAFTITQTGGGPAPTVTAVNVIDGDASYIKVTWSRPITLRQWTTIIASGVCGAGAVPVVNLGNLGPVTNEPDRVDYGFLPANVDQNNVVNPLDLLKFKRYVNMLEVPLCNTVPFFADTDRNLAVGPLDLLAFKRLIAGLPPATQVWNGVTMASPRP